MAHPLRILYVNSSAGTCGASRCLVRLCEKLDRARFEPLAFLPANGIPRPDFV
jgi:hypothetical protein